MALDLGAFLATLDRGQLRGGTRRPRGAAPDLAVIGHRDGPAQLRTEPKDYLAGRRVAALDRGIVGLLLVCLVPAEAVFAAGLVMGEGATSLIVEELEHARARSARIYAEVLGYSLNNDAFHMTAPLPSGDSCIRAMREALADAQLAPEQIDYINAHASSTQLNDGAETMSIKQVFGEDAQRIPVSGTKGYYAHPLGATGAIEAALCTLALDRQWIPPTINYQNPDPACDLDVVPNNGRKAQLNYIMSNSFGFGGINACVILGRVS